MKKILTLIIILLLINSVKAQNYVPFPDSNAIWSEWHKPPIFPGNPPYYYRNAITNRDTIINTKTYHQIFHSLTDSLFINPANFNYIGGLREYNKQVFFIPMDSINEYLIYDFSKSVGDTIVYDYSKFAHNSYGISFRDTLIIANIDSVLLNDGLYRKRFHLTDIWGIPSIYFPRWIEGIGGDMGLLWPVGELPTNGVNNYLVCFQQNKNEVYFNTLFSTCFPIIDNISEYLNDNQLIVSPNPVNDYCKINWRNIRNGTYNTVMITDMYGNIIYNKTIENTNVLTINCQSFKCGFYLIKISNASNNILISKFIVL